MAAIYIIKSENNMRDRTCRNSKCEQPFKNGQKVIRVTVGAHGRSATYHIEHYVDAHGVQIYE